MPIGKMSRENLRNHRKFVHMALADYASQASEKIGAGVGVVSMRILESVRGTRIRVPKTIVPEKFITMVLEANETKKYRIEFCQNRTGYIYIILKNKPLIEEGQGILLFFFRELLQHIENDSDDSKKSPRLIASISVRQKKVA